MYIAYVVIAKKLKHTAISKNSHNLLLILLHHHDGFCDTTLNDQILYAIFLLIQLSAVPYNMCIFLPSIMEDYIKFTFVI